MRISTVWIVLAVALSASAQEKPRVFVQGKGSEDTQSSGSAAGGKHWGAWGARSTTDSHDESMEVTKDLQKNCSAVTVTLNQTNADYTLMLNRESKKNRGLLRSNSQVQVANKDGDILGTNATHTVGNAAKDACQLIIADWQTHGRLNAPATAAAPAQTPAQVTPAAYQPQQAAATLSQPDDAVPANATKDPDPNASIADAAHQAKQHQACLQLAKDNPSIVCK
ncbi:MAG: hypothetical protein ACRD3B_02110 [Candidatus Sulfotelmatobacter sp.]